jgi:hypothetical protein
VTAVTARPAGTADNRPIASVSALQANRNLAMLKTNSSFVNFASLLLAAIPFMALAFSAAMSVGSVA